MNDYEKGFKNGKDYIWLGLMLGIIIGGLSITSVLMYLGVCKP